MFREDRGYFNLVSLRFSIGTLASTSGQFLVSQRRPRTVELNVNARRGADSQPWAGAQEIFRQSADPQGEALELPGIHLQSGMGMEILLRVDERFAGRRSTNRTG
jgi:hypothetical protein